VGVPAFSTIRLSFWGRETGIRIDTCVSIALKHKTPAVTTLEAAFELTPTEEMVTDKRFIVKYIRHQIVD